MTVMNKFNEQVQYKYNRNQYRLQLQLNYITQT